MVRHLVVDHLYMENLLHLLHLKLRERQLFHLVVQQDLDAVLAVVVQQNLDVVHLLHLDRQVFHLDVAVRLGELVVQVSVVVVAFRYRMDYFLQRAVADAASQFRMDYFHQVSDLVSVMIVLIEMIVMIVVTVPVVLEYLLELQMMEQDVQQV